MPTSNESQVNLIDFAPCSNASKFAVGIFGECTPLAMLRIKIDTRQLDAGYLIYGGRPMFAHGERGAVRGGRAVSF